MSHVFAPDPIPCVPVAGSDDSFPGAAHLLRRPQLRGACQRDGLRPDREPPFFFCKPADAVVPVAPGHGRPPYPTANRQLPPRSRTGGGHRQGGSDIAAANANDHVWGYAVGFDMTRRDLQFALRDKGRPWELGKAFDQSAPIAPMRPRQPLRPSRAHPAASGSR
jgi:fumarylpyruvate hydrolase